MYGEAGQSRGDKKRTVERTARAKPQNHWAPAAQGSGSAEPKRKDSDSHWVASIFWLLLKKKKKKAALISENQPTFLRAIPVLNSQGLPQWPLPDPSWRLPVSPASLFWVSDPRLLTSSELAKGDGDQRSHPGALPSSPGSLSSPGLPVSHSCAAFSP